VLRSTTLGALGASRKTGEHDAVTLPTNGHFTSLETTTPRNRSDSCGGASDRVVSRRPEGRIAVACVA
jgi:hypothetical protein